MSFDRSIRVVFDEAPEDYDAGRPIYPEALTEDVIALSGIPEDGRILEIGPGPGKATLLFARRGYRMLCLELGAALAAQAAANCRPYPRVQIQRMTFEDWPLQPSAFDLVMSAQVFHWIPPEVGLPKCAAALKDSGWLALFWNDYPTPDNEFFNQLAVIYQEKAPDLASRSGKPSMEELVEIRRKSIQDSHLFDDVLLKRYPWEMTYTTERYLKLLNTFSDHRTLDEDTRRDLFGGIAELIEQHGGSFQRPFITALYMARVRR